MRSLCAAPTGWSWATLLLSLNYNYKPRGRVASRPALVGNGRRGRGPVFIPSSDRDRVITIDDVRGQIPGYEQVDDYTILAYDPGGTTGWAAMGIHKLAMRRPDYLIVPNINWWSAGELVGPEGKQAAAMAEAATAWCSAHIVVEDFILQKFSPARELLAPVRVTARFEQAIGSRHIILQMPSLAMTTVDDDRLRSIEMWVKGSEHARVSVKHCLVWAQRAKKIIARRTANNV